MNKHVKLNRRTFVLGTAAAGAGLALGMDIPFGNNMFDSFVRYQTRVIRALDVMAKKYGFVTIDAGRAPDVIFRDLQGHIRGLELRKVREFPRINGANGAKRPKRKTR